MKNATVKIDMSDFSKKIKRLGDIDRGDALLRAVRAGGEVIRANAMINANNVFSSKANNDLANSIIVEEVSGGAKPLVNIGPTVIYGRIQELGGVIEPVFKKFLSWIGADGERVFAKSVTLPARPYLRPAVDEHMPDIKEAIEVTLNAEITRLLK